MSEWDIVGEAPVAVAPAVPSTGRPHITITPNPPAAAGPGGDGGANQWEVAHEAPIPGIGETALRGLAQGASLGLGDEEAGAVAAGHKTLNDALPAGAMQGLDTSSPLGGLILRALTGAGRVGYDKLTGQTSDATTEYEKTRDSERAANAAAQQANPGTYTAANIVGGVAAPLPGASFLKGANWLTRLGRGAVRAAPEGAVAGYGYNEKPEDATTDVLKSAGLASLLGGPANSIFGRRAAPTLSRAAQTADNAGAPLPVGLASERPWVQSLTKGAEHLPLVGTLISNRARRSVEAVGEHVEGMVNRTTGGATDRATTGAILRPALEHVVENNNAATDAAYNTLRNTAINADRRMGPLHNTGAVLDRIAQERQTAGARNGYAGLEEVQNIARGGTTFNGLQRARAAVGRMIDFPEANGGHEAGDLKRLYAAMTRDMFAVAAVSRRPGVSQQQAMAALRAAHDAAATHIEANKRLSQVLRARADETLAGNVLTAGKNKGGNVGLLVQLRQAMNPADFEHVAGAVLHELGHSKTTGTFNIKQFSKGWDDLSPAARRVLFPQAQRAQLDDFAHLANHLRDVERYANHSGTGRQVALTGLIAGAGGLAAGEGGLEKLKKYGGPVVLGGALATLLARPATAATMGRFARAVQRVGVNPDAASLAMYKIATRNVAGALSDQLGKTVDVADVPVLLFALTASGRGGVADEHEDPQDNTGANDTR